MFGADVGEGSRSAAGAGADGVVDDFGVAAVGADSPFLEEGLVGGADLEGVDDVAVTSGVEAVARGEFLDGEGAGSLVFVAFDVVVAVGVEAPHGDFEGGGVVDEGVVGQQAESFEARQRVVVAVVGEEAGYRAALAAQVAEQFVFELGAVFVFEVGDGPVESVSAVGEFALVGFPDFDCLFDGEFDAGSGVVAQQRLGFVGDGVAEQLQEGVDVDWVGGRCVDGAAQDAVGFEASVDDVADLSGDAFAADGEIGGAVEQVGVVLAFEGFEGVEVAVRGAHLAVDHGVGLAQVVEAVSVALDEGGDEGVAGGAAGSAGVGCSWPVWAARR